MLTLLQTNSKGSLKSLVCAKEILQDTAGLVTIMTNNIHRPVHLAFIWIMLRTELMSPLLIIRSAAEEREWSLSDVARLC